MQQHIKYLSLLTLLAFIIGYAFFKPDKATVQPQPVAKANTKKVKKIDMQGHRGSRGLKPENTWPSFAKAIELGMTTLELDLNITADKQLIVYHDFNLSRRLCKTTNGQRLPKKPIRTFTVAQLKQLDCGLAQKKFPEQEAIANTRLITLSEFFQKMTEFEETNEKAKDVRYNLELKIRSKTFTETDIFEVAQVLVNEMKKARVIERSMVQSFNMPVLAAIKHIEPHIETGALFALKPFRRAHRAGQHDKINRTVVDRTLKVKSISVNIQRHLLNDELVTMAHQKGLKVYVWTVNDPYEIVNLLKHNVDGIITDYPNRLVFTYQMWQDVNNFKPDMIEAGDELRIPEHVITKRIPQGVEARNLFLHMVASVINKPLEAIRIVK